MENSSDTNQRHPESSETAIGQLWLRLAEYFSKKRSNRETAEWPAFNGIITSVEAFQIITRAVTICPRHGVNYKTKTVPVDICAMLRRHIMWYWMQKGRYLHFCIIWYNVFYQHCCANLWRILQWACCGESAKWIRGWTQQEKRGFDEDPVFQGEPSLTSFMWWTSNADGQNVCSHANKNNCNVSFLNFCLPIKSYRNENLWVM